MADTSTIIDSPPISWVDARDDVKEELITKAPSATPAMWQALLKKHNIITTLEQSSIRKLTTTDLEEKTSEIENPEHDTSFFGHGGHGGVHGGHEMPVDMLHAVENHEKFQQIHEELQKADKWNAEEAFRKKFSKNPDLNSQEWRDFVDRHSYDLKKDAETRFRKQNSKLAARLDKEAARDTTAGNYKEDPIGKQFQKSAREDAEHEVEKVKKKFEKGKLSFTQYSEQATKIHDKHQLNFAKQFAKRYKEKATYYAQVKNDPLLQKAFEQIRFGRAKRYYNKQKKQARITTRTRPQNIQQRSKKRISVLSRSRQKIQQLVRHITTPPPQPKQENFFDHDIVRNTPTEISYPQMLPNISQQPSPASPPQRQPEQSNGRRGSNPAENLAKNQLKKLGSTLLKEGAKSLIKLLFGPPFIGEIILVIVILLLILIAILFKGNNNSQNGSQPIPGLTINIDGPTQVANGTNQIRYFITITYTGTDSVQISNPIPNNTAFISATDNPSNTNNTLAWNLDNLTPTITGTTKTYTLIIVFHPSTNNVNINEVVTANDLTNQTNPVPGLTLQNSAPIQVANGKPITYSLIYTYTGTDATVTIFDQIPAHTTLVGNPSGKFTNTNGLLGWVIKDNKSPLTFTVQPDVTLNDTVLSNDAYATGQGTNYNGPGTNIVWLNSDNHVEFDPHFPAWVWSQCSQASMAEIFNAYAPNNPDGSPKYKIVDLETWALQNGVWDPTLGLLGPLQANITKEATHYGFTTDYKTYPVNSQSLDTLIGIAKQGHPIMVSAPGHWLVLWGADPDNQHLWLLDSSIHDFTWAPNAYPVGAETFKMARNDFLNGGLNNTDLATQYWTGVAVVMTQQ